LAWALLLRCLQHGLAQGLCCKHCCSAPQAADACQHSTQPVLLLHLLLHGPLAQQPWQQQFLLLLLLWQQRLGCQLLTQQGS
jgi:hypothetical protein